MTGFALLWQKTLYSSLWVNESKETRLLFITMLMLKNSSGVIQASIVGLADAAKITPDECKASLKILMSPDPNDTSKVEEGKRIKEVPGGWQIINSDLYRFSTEAKRAFWAQQKAEQRAKDAAPNPAKKKPKGKPLPGEDAYVKDIENHGPEVADANFNKAQNGHAAPADETFTQRAEREVRERLAMKAQQNRGGDQ